MKILFSFLFCLGLFPCFSQTSISCGTYKADTIYENNFTEVQDSLFWLGDDGLRFGKITQGNYYLESYDESYAKWSLLPFDVLNDSTNFTIEYTIKSIDDSNLYYGIVLGDFESENSRIYFYINNNGQYIIEADFSRLAEGSFEVSSKNDYKKLKIVRIDNFISFFIDGTYVYEHEKHAPLYKVITGPLTGVGSGIFVDSFIITEIY